MSLQLVEGLDIPLAGTGSQPLPRPRPRARQEEIAELLAAIRQAEAERDAKGAFFSYLTHELPTPLSAIASMADLLRESQLSADQREMVAIMRRGAQDLVGMVNNALELARLDVGKNDLQRVVFEPYLSIEECFDLVSSAAAEKGLELAYSISGDRPMRLTGDPDRVRQILVNLVGNAVKFTATGEVLVELTTRPTADGSCDAHFSVRDTGPGIPPDRLDAVFPEFTEAGALGPSRLARRGLGLTIARRLAEMMGGRMWADTLPGEGTTVHFTIGSQTDAGESEVARGDPSLNGRRILVVDGAPGGRMIAETVKRWGMEASVTADVTDALDLLRSGGRFAAVLIDGRLTDRRSLSSEIRLLPGGDQVPLVLLTSLTTRGLDESLAGSGGRARFAAYLSKPLRVAKLQDVLVRVLKGATAPSPAGSRSPLRVGLPAPPATAPAPRVSDPQCSAGLIGVRIVVADDEPQVRQVLERLLIAEGVDVVAVGDGEAALKEVERIEPDLVLLDVAMPKLDGFEVCRRLKENESTRLIPVVLVTGLNSKVDRIRGIDAGADDVLHKPWERSELIARVRSLVRLKRFTNQLDRVEGVLVAMARCMESRDPDTHGHCERLSEYASRLGRRMGLEEADINALRLAGIVHDIGKVAIPDAILFKTQPLTEDEWVVMREHPVEGERICAGLAAFRRVLPIIRHHHERLDGSGYPDGLRGEAVPVTARTLQIVDIYDALTTRRSYKPAISPREALDVLRSEVDRGWRDERVFKAFEELILDDLSRAGS